MKKTSYIMFHTMIAVVLCGCAHIRTYSGPPLSREKVSELYVAGTLSSSTLSIDGKYMGATGLCVYELLPGHHHLVIEYDALVGYHSSTDARSGGIAFTSTSTYSRGHAFVDLVAEPGCKYKLLGEDGDYTIQKK